MNQSHKGANIIDLILTFRGIDVPTMKMLGKDACGLTLRRIIDGREQDSGPLLFAYQEGIIWKSVLPDAEQGQFRLTLINNHFHCAQEVTVNDSVLADRVLRVEFNPEHCRRKLFPHFIRQIWWSLCGFLEKRRENPNRDQKVLSQYRRRFRRGPIGSWLSSHERLTDYGCSFEFREDFTGTAVTWGYDDDDDSEAKRDFRWRVVGDFSIDVHPVDGEVNPDDWGILNYEFKVSRSSNGTREMLMYSTNAPEMDNADPGFWWSPHPVTLVEE